MTTDNRVDVTQWMTVKDAADHAGCSEKTVRRALRLYQRSKAQKGMRGAQPNGPNSNWRIRRDDVDRWCSGEPPLRAPRGLRAA